MTHKPQHYARLITQSMSLYLKNYRKGAFEVLDVEKYRSAHVGNSSGDKHDGSSLLRSCHALLNLFEGLLAGSSDVMSQCIDEFWDSERLANNSADKEWIGNRLSRGMSYLLGGMLQVFTHAYVKAGVNLTIAFKLLRDLEKDIVEYSGAESSLIRSLGFLVLGLLNLLSVILPPSVSSIGEYLGLGVSKEKYYYYTDNCVGEFSVVSNMIYIYFVINSKNFLFEKATETELQKCRVLIDACLASGPHSVVVHVMHASVCLGEGSPVRAIATLSEILPVVDSTPEWATMGLAAYFKLGNCHLSNLDFASAQSAFHNAAMCVSRANRWAYLPFMHTMEGLCFLASRGPTEDLGTIRKKGLEIFAPTFIDRDTSRVILPGDRWGARVGYEQTVRLVNFSDADLRTFICESKTPLVETLYAMLTVLYTFEKIDKSKLSVLISCIKQTPSSTLMTKTVLGEYYRLVGKYGKSVSHFDDAIEAIDAKIRAGETCDPDSILGFSLAYQGAALCSCEEWETAKEVLSDLDATLGQTRYIGKSQKISPMLNPGNIVELKGNELELMLNFRKNGLKRRINNH